MLALTVLASTGQAAAPPERWFEDAQAGRGETAYRSLCAGCHGVTGEGAGDWQGRDAGGRYPAPPLDGTGHTWHHSLEVLARTIRDGGGALGGSMPAFGNVVEDGEIVDLLAYIQSLWPRDIYQAWAQSYPDDARNGAGDGGMQEPAVLTARLRKRLAADTEVSAPMESPVAGLHVVKAGDDYVYLADRGRYALLGDLVDLESGDNHTESLRSKDRLAALKRFPASQMIVFEAWDEERAAITVLTDTTCPFCRRLHVDLPELQAMGVTVRYVPFPRGGAEGQGYAELRSVWCAQDRQAAVAEAMDPEVRPLNDGRCPAAAAVDAGYRLGNEIRLRGTPGILLANGRLIQGYRSAEDLIAAIGLAP